MVQTLFNSIVKWAACVATMSGALATTLSIDPLNVFLLTLGGVLYLTWSICIREWNLIVVNVALLAIYGYGTVLRLCSGIS
jgi:hypothetical protein